jgi:hypothetical protein
MSTLLNENNQNNARKPKKDFISIGAAMDTMAKAYFSVSYGDREGLIAAFNAFVGVKTPSVFSTTAVGQQIPTLGGQESAVSSVTRSIREPLQTTRLISQPLKKGKGKQKQVVKATGTKILPKKNTWAEFDPKLPKLQKRCDDAKADVIEAFPSMKVKGAFARELPEAISDYDQILASDIYKIWHSHRTAFLNARAAVKDAHSAKYPHTGPVKANPKSLRSRKRARKLKRAKQAEEKAKKAENPPPADVDMSNQH